jgi:hypothetical protein
LIQGNHASWEENNDFLIHELDLESRKWSKVSMKKGRKPSMRSYHQVCALHKEGQKTHQLAMFGGIPNLAEKEDFPDQDLHVLNYYEGGSALWSKVRVVGDKPPPRSQHTMIY